VAAGFAILAAGLFGLFTVGMRTALYWHRDPGLGAAAAGLIGLATSLVIAAAADVTAGDAHPADVWRFFLVGVFVPGLSSILFARAVRDAGPSRVAIVIGTAPALSAFLAITLLGEPLKAGLAVGTVLIVSGGVVLALEQSRPHDFRVIGLVFAIACALLFATRDNVVRVTATHVHPDPLAATIASLAGAAAVTTGIALARGQARTLLPAFRWFFVAGVALGGAYSALLVALDRGRVTIVAPLNATQSLFAVVLALIVLRRTEMVGTRLVLAAVLVVAGSVIIGIER
jgi:drug/metabolite transporter (DMT)-like permease